MKVILIPIRVRNILYKPKHLMKIFYTSLKSDMNINKEII